MAPRHKYCSSEIHSFYLEQAIFIPLFIALQLTLLCHTIYEYYKYRNHASFQKISKSSRTLYIVLQIIGLSWTLFDSFRFVIDPVALILRNNIGCDIVGTAPYYIIGPYYAVYLYQILLRLQASFRDSILEIPSYLMIILKLLIIIPVIIGPIIFYILTQNEYTCLLVAESSANNLSFCHLPTTPQSAILLIVAVIYIILLNAIFASIFTVKLNSILSDDYRKDETAKFKFKSLIIKNGILTITGSISTMAAYILWLTPILDLGYFFLYFDLFLNCLVIGLMFKYNEKWYKKCCRCCIVLCLTNCDKSKNKMSTKDVFKYVNRTRGSVITTTNATSISPREHAKNGHQVHNYSDDPIKIQKLETLTIDHNPDTIQKLDTLTEFDCDDDDDDDHVANNNNNNNNNQSHHKNGDTITSIDTLNNLEMTIDNELEPKSEEIVSEIVYWD